MSLEVTKQELLKQAIYLKKLYETTRVQDYKDQETRIRRIVVELESLVIGTSNVTNLDSLSDVTISAPANAQVLAYNSTTLQWENQTPAAGGGGDMLKCFHPETELLTLNGWKKITDISFNDEIATLNQETKELEYQVPNHIFKYEYDGELIGRETKQLSYLVTPNHRMYVRKWYGGQRGLVWSENFYWERADEVSEKIRSFPITAKWTGVKTETNPFGIDDDLFLEFLGWFLAEGCVVDTKIYVTQTKSKTIADCTRVMVEMAKSLERTLGYNQNAHFNFRHSELAKFLSQFGKHAHNKFIPSFVKNLPPEKLILFYSAYYKGDGHLNGNNISTVSKRMADDLQEIILKLGGYATIVKGSPAVTSHGVRDIYRLNCNFNNLQGSTAKKDNYKIDYKGFVHCVEVDNATLYTRFNGKPVFLGNSTYDVDNDGVVDSAETTQIIVRNSTGSTLTKGQVVYLSGATGNRPNAVLSQAHTEATSSKTIGIVVANINNNSDGYIAVNGTLHDLNTSAFTAGDAVWLSAATAGAFTSTIPAEPNHAVFIGYIARAHPTQGRLVIVIQNGYELNELHGVLVTSETNNDLLVYESSTSLWKNKQISSVLSNGMLKVAAAISTTLQVVKDYLDNASVLFLNSRRIGIGKDTSVTTQSVAVVEVQDTNTSIVLKPNGTGGIIASVPDGTVTGGNLRGQYSVDLQLLRTANSQVCSGNYSGILSGFSNTASGTNSLVLGGNNNTSSGVGALTSGQNNIASGEFSTVFGRQNFASNNNSTVSGGQSNTASSSYSTVSGGQSNTASSSHSTVSGGQSNQITGSNYSTISGGQSNTASTNTHATVVGGQSNTASGQHSVVGGQTNTVSGDKAAAFGVFNNVSGYGAFATGNNNTVAGSRSIALGQSNSAAGSNSIALGLYAYASNKGTFAVGEEVYCESNYGISFGYRSMTKLYAQQALASGNFVSVGDAQQSLLTARKQDTLTTGATSSLSLDGTGTTNLIIPNGNNRAWNVQIDTIAVVTAITGTATGVSVGDTYEEKATMSFKRVGGTSSLVALGSRQQIYDTSMATAIMNFSAGASQQLQIQFQAPAFAGGGSITCRVVSKVSLVEVAY